MNSFEINKIITAVLVTILVIFGIGKISDIIFNKDDKNIVAYKVDAPEGLQVKASTESSVDISALLALGDIAHGEKQFKIHTVFATKDKKRALARIHGARRAGCSGELCRTRACTHSSSSGLRANRNEGRTMRRRGRRS